VLAEILVHSLDGVAAIEYDTSNVLRSVGTRHSRVKSPLVHGLVLRADDADLLAIETTVDWLVNGPDQVLAECDLDESCREQVEYYLAVTRYGIFNHREPNDADGLAFNDVEWSDVADWDVSPRDREK